MRATKADVNVKLQGYAAANRDAEVILTSEATGKARTTKPFLDGTVTMRDLDPGMYELEVRHPNLVRPIEKRRIRVFPQPQPTQVNIQVPEIIFRDTPIENIPDADLTPVQSAAASARAQALSVGTKSPGEAILASDWNKLATAVGDIAAALGQLALLVSPRGHDHPEIGAKFDEVQGNLRAFAEAFGKTVLEIRRQFETEKLRDDADEVLTLAGVDSATKRDVLDRVDNLRLGVLKDTTQFTQQLANVGTLVMTQINEIAVSKGDAGQEFLQDKRVQQLTERARTYSNAGVQTKAENELLVYQRSGSNARKAGGR